MHPRARTPKRAAIGTVLSALAMVLTPKCPLCIAAYLSVIGVSVGVGTAAVLLRALQVVSVAGLGLILISLTLWLVRRSAVRRSTAG